MKRKNRILFFLFVITIVLIGFVRYIIKKDTAKTQDAQLAFFSEHLTLQKDFILTSYQQYALIITEHIYRTKLIHELENKVLDANEEQAGEIQEQLNKFTHPIFAEMKKMGVSYVNIQINYPFKATIPSHNLVSKSPEFSFGIFNDFIGYKYDFPFVVNNTIIGIIEVGFDFHLIKEQLLEVNTNTSIGYIIVANKDQFNPQQITNKKLQSVDILPGLWMDMEFVIPQELLTNRKACKELISTVQPVSNDSSKRKDFSIFLPSQKGSLALSLAQIHSHDSHLNVYLVSSTKNQVLSKVNELNDAVFVINIIIIVLGMIGFAYLIINRLNILSQKQKIQKSEEELIAINQSKDKFFSIIAHDLKNPFNGIMGMSGYLAAEFNNVDDEEKREIINDINISSKNAFNLLQNLLEWTRTQSGSIKNIPTVIVPKQIVDFSLETVTNLAKHKDIEIIQTFLTEKNGIADENLVSTVIRNLCTNAIKFSPRNSKIEIIVKEHERELVFCVKDQGIGLMSEEIDQLFRIDMNFHKRGTEKETGSGLGLKLCKEFVGYCNGRIWVVSEPGKGSSFFFTIPLQN